VGIIVGLVLFEPDMGTGLIITAIALIIYFVAGTPIWHFLLIVPLTLVSAFIVAVASPYRFQRLLSFLDPERDPLGASYQIRQALIAVGSGGITGVGLGMSRQKYEYLPEANTDSIFAVIAEETGFFGSIFMVLLFFFLIWRGLRIARTAPDIFGKLVASGIVGWVGIQAALNISAMIAIMPLTGIPLPLISYGSTSLVILLAALGVLLNISRHNKVN
jgi:cell division protein FtsW